MSLSEKYTLTQKIGFDIVFSNPDFKLKEGCFLLYGKKNNNRYPRLGISIKKKDYKLAVQRNSIKRMVKNSFASMVNKLPPYDYVILVLKNKNLKKNYDEGNLYLFSLWKNFLIKNNEKTSS